MYSSYNAAHTGARRTIIKLVQGVSAVITVRKRKTEEQQSGLEDEHNIYTVY